MSLAYAAGLMVFRHIFCRVVADNPTAGELTQDDLDVLEVASQRNRIAFQIDVPSLVVCLAWPGPLM